MVAVNRCGVGYVRVGDPDMTDCEIEVTAGTMTYTLEGMPADEYLWDGVTVSINDQQSEISDLRKRLECPHLVHDRVYNFTDYQLRQILS